MNFYFGTPGWGWRMWGFGYKAKWFIGFSMSGETMRPKELASRIKRGEQWRVADSAATGESHEP